MRDVSDARRQGDVDPSKAILADTRKLEGNSAYGSTIMNQENFQEVKYIRGEGKAMVEINNPQFKKLTSLLDDEELYEIEKHKKKYKFKFTHTNRVLHLAVRKTSHATILLRFHG